MDEKDVTDRDRLRAYLARSPVFGPQRGPSEPAGLTEGDREALAQHPQVRIEALEDGEVLWALGDEADGLGLVLEGVLAVRRSPDDRAPAVLRRLGPGDEVGFSTLGGQPHTADLTAVGATRVAVLPHALLLPLLQARPGLALRMLAQLGHVIGLLTDEKLDLVRRGVRDRIHVWVLENIEPGEEIPVTHQHLAECVDATRPRVSHALKELEAAGVVTLRRGYVGRPPKA